MSNTNPVVAQTPQQSVNAQPPPPQNPPADGSDQKAEISGAPDPKMANLPGGQKVLSREERVEYRDQDGRLLNEEEVKALQGKVEFKTRYETRTRIVDEQGNEIGGNVNVRESEPEVVELPKEANPAGVAPPHPDVEGAGKSTQQKSVDAGTVAQVEPLSVEGSKEMEGKKAKPASEGNEATV